MSKDEPKRKSNIYQVLDFINEDGMVVQKHAPTSNGQVVYIGKAMMNVQSPMGVQHLPFEFKIEAESVSEAFENFEEAASVAGPKVKEELMKQLTQPQIIMPNQMPPGLTGR